MKQRIHIITAVLMLLVVLPTEGRTRRQARQDREIIDRVATWQIDHFKDAGHPETDWTYGALYRGLFEWADYSSNQEYLDFLMQTGDRNGWGFGDRLYHADDMCVGQMYARMYEKYGDKKMVTDLKIRMDQIVHHPSDAVLQHGIGDASDRWSWCDALFMAPPAFVEMYNIFKDEKYLQYMDREFKLTTDSLYNHTAHLYYRDRTYIPEKEANGCDVFWGRGNGWVFGGLALMLESLPKDHYTYRYYLDIFREMAGAVIRCQDADGSWHASMLDPESYPLPENSASGFFTFGLAWGWNHGVLTDPAYKSAAEKGWEALKRYVDGTGFLGYVQPIGAAPGDTGPDKTEVYGVGAFLLAGTQMVQLKRRPKAMAEVAEYIPDMSDRAYWVETMTRIVEPFYVNLSQGTLRKNMPVESRDGMIDGKDRVCTYLEGLGRSFDGIAPWLNLGPDDTPEGKLRARYIDLAVKAIANAVDPSSPDWMDFGGPGTQPLVDAAFFAQGLLRSKDVIWPALDDVTKARVIESLKASRKIKAWESNWLMFSATVEAALLEFTGEYDEAPVDKAFSKHAEWYKGDGWYGDGPEFHLDYYNSYVIQPMLLDVSAVMKAHGKKWGEFHDIELPRIIRYAEQQERLISPEGTYPVLGRSSGYRFGCFQVLSQVALLEKLPLHIEPAQVRCALTAVIRNQLAPGSFDENGWITLGFAGHQPGVADDYVTTGSAYLCTFIYLALGLPADNPFWTDPASLWSSQRTWRGLSVRDDHDL